MDHWISGEIVKAQTLRRPRERYCGRAGAIASAFFVHYGEHSTIIFLVGGIVGAILLLVLFDWALIVVSSLIGAHLIQSAVVLPATGSTIVFFGLAVVGIVVQAAALRRG